MTREQLDHCFRSLPPELQERLVQQMGAFREYLQKAGTVRTKLRADFPSIDSRAAAAVSLVVARFL